MSRIGQNQPQPTCYAMLMSYKYVNSSRVLFYLGKKFWEGHTTDIGSQGFHAQLNVLERKIQEGKMCRDLADQRDVFFILSRCYFLR